MRKNARKINFLGHGSQRIFITPPYFLIILLFLGVSSFGKIFNPPLPICLSACLSFCLSVYMYVWTYVRVYAPMYVCVIKTFSKKRLRHRCFLVNFAKFLIKPFFIEHLWWLLLKIHVQSLKILRHHVFSSNRHDICWTLKLNS